MFSAVFLGFLVSGCAGFRGCGSADRWWADDKTKHFTASAVIAAGTTALAAGAVEPDEAAFFGVAFTLGAGVAKEYRDLHVKQTCFSWKDLVWDVMGAAAGAALTRQALP